ncbi:MAG: 2-C-methyl-D-erythritol 4-phosphate cytidylyltransferase [Muribaculaceae bacterium]|nr:2-C-methyl-D-erythritol 4-phosphate cytidylyltransferase [Muribaculaceae bacterium]
MSEKNSKRHAIIVAGGSGTRFGSEVPKQFLPLEGKAVLMHTIEKFDQAGATIVVVLPAEHQEMWMAMCKDSNFPVTHTVATGGKTRFESVKNGIAAIEDLADGDLVAVHDGVRPLASVELINRCYDIAQTTGSAIPVVNPNDSIRQVLDDGTSRQLLRSSLRAVQTPQTFRAELLKGAYDVDESPLFTDDASVVESARHQVILVEGEVTNIKITTPIDMIIANELIKDMPQNQTT